MDASGAWLTIVADNNDEGDDDGDRLRADHVTQQLPQVAPWDVQVLVYMS